MNKRVLTYFILLLMALQSAVVLADVHQLHQSGTEHLTLNESHQQSQADSDAPNCDFDCQHCCHCHCHLSPAIPLKALVFVYQKIASGASIYCRQATPATIIPLLRPPIA